MIVKPINYTDVATIDSVFYGSIPAGQQNVVVGPAVYEWQQNIFMISKCFTFWGAKASGLSVGGGAFAYLQADGYELNEAANLRGGGRKPWNAAIHHNGREIDVFRRVPAGETLTFNVNLVLESNSVGVTNVELIMSMFYIIEKA